jgi:hypothetical protein
MKFASINWKTKTLWLLPLLLVLPSRSAWGQVDIGGEWAPRTYNDQRDIGDLTGIPLTEVARMRAETYSPEQLDLPQNVCRPHAWDLGMRVAPSGMYLQQDMDPVTRRITAYHLHATWAGDITIWMDGRPEPPDYAISDSAGFHSGRWEGNTLVFTTTRLPEGYLTRTGTPRSSKATITTHLNRLGDILTATIIIDDPIYLTEPYIRESSWVFTPKQVITPFPCELPEEGALVPAGRVPSNMPGEYPYIGDFAAEYGIPLDAALGGAETTRPEYIKKMKTMKVAPRTTLKHVGRSG